MLLLTHVGKHQSGSRSSIGGCSRSVMKSSITRGPLRIKIVPALTLGHNDAAAADLQNIDLMHAVGERNSLGQSHGLAAIYDEHGGAGQ
jgi:hypothetical protein